MVLAIFFNEHCMLRIHPNPESISRILTMCISHVSFHELKKYLSKYVSLYRKPFAAAICAQVLPSFKYLLHNVRVVEFLFGFLMNSVGLIQSSLMKWC